MQKIRPGYVSGKLHPYDGLMFAAQDLGMSLVNYIPMMDLCLRDLAMSLENYIPMMDLCLRDLGMSLENHPHKHK